MTLIFLFIFALTSCGDMSQERINEQKIYRAGDGFEILVIDSCEYVWCKNGYAGGLTHKGNCKFCAQRQLSK
jgi:hypothetical protein